MSENVTPTAWINSGGTAISNADYEEVKSNIKLWEGAFEKYWSDATPLYTRDQLSVLNNEVAETMTRDGD